MSGIVVQLGAIECNTGSSDTAGVRWRCGTPLDGWDSAAVEATITQRQGANGAFMAPTLLHERPLTLTGTAVAPDAVTADAARRQLLQAASLTDTVLTVNETVPKWCSVRRSGAPLTQWETRTTFTWSVLVTAPDPLLYSTTVSSGSAALPAVSGGLTVPITVPISIPATVTTSSFHLTNTGDMPSAPVFVVAGPVSQPLIVVTDMTGTTTTLAFGDDIAAGDTLTIDCTAHTVLLNASASRRRLLSGSWPVIPPGGADVSFRAAAASPTALLTGTVPAGAWM